MNEADRLFGLLPSQGPEGQQRTLGASRAEGGAEALNLLT